MTAARTTEAESPTKTVYARMVATAMATRRRRWSREVAAMAQPATIAMFQPEMATT